MRALFLALLIPLAAPLAADEFAPVRVWSHLQPEDQWYAQHASLGNRGTQAFTHTGYAGDRALLLSRHDGHPPLPVWELVTPEAEGWGAASAEHADVHASLSMESLGVNQHRVELRRFSSGGLDWTYTYPHLVGGRVHLGLAEDGVTLVIGVGNPVTGLTELVVFDSGSSAPVATWTLPSGTLWEMELSGDGTRAGFSIGSRFLVLDVATGAILLAYDTGVSWSSTHDIGISHDGSVFVGGGPFGRARVWRWNGASYDQVVDHASPEGGTVTAVGVSKDNSTVAIGFRTETHESADSHVQCLDVASGATTMSSSTESFGLFEDFATDVAVADDGSFFVAAFAGDQPQLWDEVRIFARHQDEPLATFPIWGSPVDIDLSADGNWLVVGVRGPHVYESFGWGALELWRLRPVDLDLRVTPSPGALVSIEMTGPPQAQSGLVWSLLPQTPPLALGYGTLFVDGSTLEILPLGELDGSGELTLPVALPPDPLLVGASLFAQGYTTNPKRLTEDWLTLTLVP
jgi:hypothetical protein